MKKALTILLALATSLALLVLPAAAGAEYFIPDGNSAVNQYTEGVPTGGGEKSSKGAGEKPVRPNQTLGTQNTEKLEQAGGREGREAAEVAAETAPAEIVVVEEEPGDGRAAGAGEEPGKAKAQGKAQPGDGGSAEAEGTETVVIVPVSGDGPSGSGGLGEILSAATGGSDGGVGLLLPLVIVGAIAWGIGFAWRRRDGDQAATASR